MVREFALSSVRSNVGLSIGIFDPVSRTAPLDYLHRFDYGQDMAVDLPLFTADDNIAPFGYMLDDFANIEGGWHEDISRNELGSASRAVQDAGPTKEDL